MKKLLSITILLAAALAASETPKALFFGSSAKASKVYHKNEMPVRCPAADNIKNENRILFPFSKDAEAAGRVLCRICAEIEATDREESRERRG